MTDRDWSSQPLDFSGGVHVTLLYSVMAAVVVIHISALWHLHLDFAVKTWQHIWTVVTMLRAAGRRAVAACRVAPEQDTNSMSFKVHKRLHLLTCRRLVAAALPFANFYCFIEVGILLLVWFGVAWERDFRVDFGIIVWHTMFILMSTCPWLISKKGFRECLYSIYMLSFIMVMGVDFRHERFERMSPIVTTGRIGVSLFVINLPLKMFWNSLYVGVLSYGYIVTPSLSTMPPGEFLTRELLTLALHMILEWWWELQQTRDCEMYIKNHSATKEHVAFNALLNATYDVVVRLDAHMQIVEGGDKLACLLLHQSGSHLDYMDFRKLLPLDDDKNRFNLSISRPALETSAVAHSLHVHMRDSIGNLVAFELFHASLVDWEDQSSHLIGIRETTKTNIPEALTLDPLADNFRERQDPLHGLASKQDRSQKLSMKLDLSDMTLIEASAAFSRLFGPYTGKPSRWVLSEDLWGWFQKEVHQISYKSAGRDSVVTKEGLKIRAASSNKCPSHEFQATVSITFAELSDSDSEEDDVQCKGLDNMMACVVLTDIVALRSQQRQVEQGNPQRKPSRSSRSSSSQCSSASQLMQRISEQ